jgi:hypothetical protein
MLLGTKVCARKEFWGSVRNETFGEEGIEFAPSLRNGLHARSQIRHRHLESLYKRRRENQLQHRSWREALRHRGKRCGILFDVSHLPGCRARP